MYIYILLKKKLIIDKFINYKIKFLNEINFYYLLLMIEIKFFLKILIK